MALSTVLSSHLWVTLCDHKSHLPCLPADHADQTWGGQATIYRPVASRVSKTNSSTQRLQWLALKTVNELPQWVDRSHKARQWHRGWRINAIILRDKEAKTQRSQVICLIGGLILKPTLPTSTPYSQTAPQSNRITFNADKFLLYKLMEGNVTGEWTEG